MKKILSIMLLSLLLTSCSDYKEVNNLAIINSIGIDYEDNNYVVTLEVLDNKINKQSGKIISYTTVGKDRDIANAIEKSADNISLRPYYPHIKLCIISKFIAREHLKDITDYFIRNNYFRETFLVVITDKKSPYTILSHSTKNEPIPGNSIVNLIKNNSYASNAGIDKKFIGLLKEIVDFGKDASASVIDIQNDNFIINGMAIFNDYNLVTILDNDNATLYNLLKSNISKPLFNVKINKKNFAVVIYNAKTNLNIENNTLNINGTYRAKIVNNETNLNIKNKKDLKKANKEVGKYINKLILNYIQICQKYNSDSLGIENTHYIKARKKENFYWQHLKVKSNIKVIINKKGLVFKKYENK